MSSATEPRRRTRKDPYEGKTAYVWREGRDDAVYRGDAVNSVSNTELQCFRKSPELYYDQFIGKTVPFERKAALDIGSGLHEQVLLPDGLSKIVEIPAECLASNGNRNTRSKEWQQFAAENAGKYLLKADEIALVRTMRDAVLAKDALRGFFDHPEARTELPIKALCGDSGLWCRCKIDLLSEEATGQPVDIDLKTTACDVGDLKALAGAILRYGYHRQRSHYRKCLKGVIGEKWAPRGILAFIEKKPPFRVRLIELEEQWLDKADAENRQTLLAMAKARESCEFKTVAIDDVISLGWPRWADFADEWQVSEE